MKLKIAVFAALLALGACKDKEKESGDKSNKGDTAGKTAEVDKGEKSKEGAMAPLKIEKLGLTMDAPAGAKVSELAGSQMIQAPGLVVGIEEAGQFSAKTLAAEIEDLKSTYSGTDVTQEEVENGWHVTFINKGGMGKNYWVKSHLTFDGKVYTCGTTSPNPEHQATALAACKSLRK
ncbi:MAG: hypothetical protein JKY56_15915 [Kofleriaceae bacterium]|nr:hypothetical protein [Kofleriaceae bacterium]